MATKAYLQGRSHGHHGHHHGRRHHHGNRHYHGGRYYYGGYWGGPAYYGFGPGWGYGYPYYDYPVVPIIGFNFSTTREVKPKKIIGSYSVSNKTERKLRIATTLEDKDLFPGDVITIRYAKKLLIITSTNPEERIEIRPLSRCIVITEQKNGRLYVKD